MLRVEGTVRGIVIPEMFLTKICMVSAGSGLAERELEGEECIVCGGLVDWWFGGLQRCREGEDECLELGRVARAVAVLGG